MTTPVPLSVIAVTFEPAVPIDTEPVLVPELVMVPALFTTPERLMPLRV